MKNEDTLYWLWLSLKCGIASKDFNRLVERYDDPFELYRMDEGEVEQLDGFSKRLKEKLCEKDLDASYGILKYCQQNSIDVISYGDRRYPDRLRALQDPPILLYCKGHFPDFNSRLCIGIVGTRRMSEYGKQSAYKIAYELSEASVLTVSGMAKGIDGVAACGTLSAGGDTVAVLGCGIDRVYPSEHKKLFSEIARHGAVITEYPPKEVPHGYNFPKRNRIISGLCQGVLIIEAPAGSGALITAKEAIAQGREVFALPGKINDANAEGPNELIKSGAYTVLGSSDILERYEFLYGDVYDVNAPFTAKKPCPTADPTLKRYGLDYALRVIEQETDEKMMSPLKKDTEKGRCDEPPHRAKADTGMQDYNELLAGLDDTTRRIFEALPQDRAVSADAVVCDGITVADAITSLTLLELQGLVSSLPGGVYIRK